jgi:hypothetical protein
MIPTRNQQNTARGFTTNRGVSNNFEIPWNIPNVPRNIAGNFGQRLRILEYSAHPSNCLPDFRPARFSCVRVPQGMKNYFGSSSAEEKKETAKHWIRRSVVGLSSWRLGFDPRSTWDVVDKVVLGQVSLPVRPSSLVNIFPSMFDTHHLHAALTRRINRRSLGTFQKRNTLSQIGKRRI